MKRSPFYKANIIRRTFLDGFKIIFIDLYVPYIILVNLKHYSCYCFRPFPFFKWFL